MADFVDLQAVAKFNCGFLGRLVERVVLEGNTG